MEKNAIAAGMKKSAKKNVATPERSASRTDFSIPMLKDANGVQVGCKESLTHFVSSNHV